MGRLERSWAWLIALTACGPAVPIDQEDTSSGSDGQITTATTIGSTSVADTTNGGTTGPGTTTTSDPSDPSDPTDDVTTEASSVSTVGFIDPSDTGPPPSECDLWLEDCPEGEKCMPWANDGGNAWNATRCTPLDPNPQQPGEPCTVEGSGVSGIDNCAFHSMCFGVDPDTNMGTCVAMCIGDEAQPQCADGCSTCALTGDGVLILCLPNCDPVVPDACAEGNVCIPVQSSFGCVFDASGDAGAAGDPCEFSNACDPGLFCADADVVPGCDGGSAGCCAPFCNLDDAEDGCDALLPGTACTPWFEGGGEPPPCVTSSIGVCAAP